ncbi:MAG: hypothetical protein V2I43_11145 [Parvularcula sp.]|nr:hypothetical protein [Parvularcula sp.]
MEDTAFYRDVTHLALNEVGADPSCFSLSNDAFHQDILTRHNSWPLAMNATSTHDTKRSEDARARLIALTWQDSDVLAELSDLKEACSAPNERAAWHLVQAALAIWSEAGAEEPNIVERLERYLIKAEREAKKETSWTDQNEAYEDNLRSAVHSLIGSSHARLGAVYEKIRSDVEHIVLARTALKLTVPGIPDIYQGTEFENTRLVDPDNRATVLESTAQIETELDQKKFDLTRQLLALRRQQPRLFTEGNYTPVDSGNDAFCFERAGSRRLTVAVRLRRNASLPAPPSSCIAHDDWGWVAYFPT